MTSLSICPRRRVCTKSDNIEWLEGIPDHWGIVPSKVLFSVSNERAHPGDEHLSATQAYGVIPLSEYERIVGRQITKTLRHEEKRRHVEPDDFVISMRSFQGGLERVWVPGSVRSSYVVLRPSSRVHVPFFAHLLKSEKYIQALRATSNFIRDGQDLNINNFKLVDLPLVPLPEQKAIANFLDRKTAAIDALIEKKEKLLELLAEKRSALINKAVTKGLNPNVPMKDSGIPWIGAVPVTWQVKRLRYVSPEITVGIVITPSKYYVDLGVPCPRSLNVKPMVLSEEGMVFISEESNRQLAKSRIFKGDLVSVRTGQPGTTAIVDDRFDGANCIDLIIIRSSEQTSSKFLAYVLNSEKSKAQYTQGGCGAIQMHFNVGTAKNLLLCIPPLEEQNQIARFLEQELSGLQALSEKTEVSINKLREYRQSLITAAVTGQLEIPAEDYEASPTEDRPS